MIQVVAILGTIYLATNIVPASIPLESDRKKAADVAHDVGVAGLRVVIDPVTGAILDNPTSAELRAVGNDEKGSVPRRSSWELRSFPLPGGGEGVVLDKWAHHSLTVKRTPSGDLHVDCSKHATGHTAPTELEQ